MTIDEAKKIAGVIKEADHGCPFCVQALCSDLNKVFPGFKWTYREDEVEVVTCVDVEEVT